MWQRLGYALLLGIIFNFILDLIFSLVYTNYTLFQPFTHYLASIFLTYLVFESIYFTNKPLSKSYKWDHKPYQRFIYQFVINSVIAIIIIESIRLAIKLLQGDAYYISIFDELIITIFILIVVFIITAIDLSIFLLNKWRFSLAELEKFKKENAEIRFESLRSQLNPHFLFNSLNTLSSLIYENQKNAELFIRELSDVYRYILENRDKELVPLSKELEFAQSYIHLIQLRFDKNLIVIADLRLGNKKYNIAPLTLQLLIENAIKHNIISKKYPLKINIFMEDNSLIVKNEVQLKQTKEYSSEMGLKNIQSRYGYLTNRKVEVDEGIKDFTVKIPLI